MLKIQKIMKHQDYYNEAGIKMFNQNRTNDKIRQQKIER